MAKTSGNRTGPRGRLRLWSRIFTTSAIVLIITGGVGRAADPQVEQKFKDFCAEWMKKLVVREHDNRANIKWENGPDGVKGEFVGYDTQNVCEVKEPVSPGAVPVGTIKYRELRYRKSGATKEEAAQSPDTAIEVTEVTEIFRYTGGKWVY